jgi:hypothetical protein
MFLGVALGGLLIVTAPGVAGMIAFGGPTPPPPLLSIRDAVLKRDRTDLPKPTFFPARDQTTLAYRGYPQKRTWFSAIVIQFNDRVARSGANKRGGRSGCWSAGHRGCPIPGNRAP